MLTSLFSASILILSFAFIAAAQPVEIIRGGKPKKGGYKEITPGKQPPKPVAGGAATNAKRWSVSYNIIVNGENTTTQNNTTEYWKIKRLYSGEAVLDQKRPVIPPIPAIALKYLSPQQVAEAKKHQAEQPDAAWDEPRTAGRIYRGTLEKISDHQKVTTGSGGDQNIIDRKWESDGMRQTGGGAFVTFDLKDNSFTVLIPFGAVDQTKPIIYTESERTISPGQPPLPPREKLPQQLNSVSYPQAAGFLDASGAISFKSNPGDLNLSAATWTFQSDEMPVSNFPRAGAKVRIILHFTRN